MKNGNRTSILVRTLIGLALACLALNLAMAQSATPPPEVRQFAQSVVWIENHSVMFRLNGKVVYLNPYRIYAKTPKADLIVVTDGHNEYWQFDSIANVIASSDTPIWGPSEVVYQLKAKYPNNLSTIKPGQTVEFGGITFHFIPAYTFKRPNYHPKSMEWMGVVVEFGGRRYYFTSGTENIPEIKDVHCDAIFLPVGTRFTMTSVQEAADAVLASGAAIAVPIGWGSDEGTLQDAQELQRLLAGKVETIVALRAQPK